LLTHSLFLVSPGRETLYALGFNVMVSVSYNLVSFERDLERIFQKVFNMQDNFLYWLLDFRKLCIFFDMTSNT
jgi:hypothetical protein